MKHTHLGLCFLLSISILMSGCGSKQEEKKEKPKTEATESTEEKQKDSLEGGYTCIGMDFGETGTFEEDMFGTPLDQVFRLSAWDDGMLVLTAIDEELGDDDMAFTWTRENDTLTLIPLTNEEMTEAYAASVPEPDVLDLRVTSSETVDGEDIETTIVYRFKKDGNPVMSLARFQPVLSEEEIYTMNNFMQRATAIILDDVIYARNKTDGLICANLEKIENSGSVNVNDIQVLYEDPQSFPGYLQAYDGFVYGCFNVYDSGEKNGIFRIDTKSNEFELLYDKKASYLQVFNGELYFTDENNHYMKADPNYLVTYSYEKEGSGFSGIYVGANYDPGSNFGGMISSIR